LGTFGSFDFEALKTDLALFEMLYPIMSELEKLTKLISDTTTVAGSEAYTAARLIYGYAKMSGKSAELDPLIEDLKKRYRRKPATKLDASGP
jgi:hypothetical protein